MFREPALPFWSPVTLLATWFGSGLARRAPGTWGSLAALPFAAVIHWLGGGWALLAASLLVFALGLAVSGVYARAGDDPDPGAVVIDEVAGQWLTLAPLCLSWESYAFGFLLFRAFDISKLWPVSLVEARFGGAFGIMADDMVAGLYAGLIGYALFMWIGFETCFP